MLNTIRIAFARALLRVAKGLSEVARRIIKAEEKAST